MTSTHLRTTLALAATTAVLAAGAAFAPSAYAGGPGQVYVYGPTATQCNDNLGKMVSLYRHNGYTVTGINSCRLTGNRTQYFGDFVAN